MYSTYPTLQPWVRHSVDLHRLRGALESLGLGIQKSGCITNPNRLGSFCDFSEWCAHGVLSLLRACLSHASTWTGVSSVRVFIDLIVDEIR